MIYKFFSEMTDAELLKVLPCNRSEIWTNEVLARLLARNPAKRKAKKK